MQDMQDNGGTFQFPEILCAKINPCTGLQLLCQTGMQMTAANDIALKMKVGKLVIQSAVKVCRNLKCENQVFLSSVPERMYLMLIDQINISFFQFILFVF